MEEEKDSSFVASEKEEQVTGPPQVLPEEPEKKIARLEQALKEKEAELAAQSDLLKRVAAEFENYKKRVAKEKEEFRKYAVESLIKEILPVLDNLERAVTHGEGANQSSALVEGVKMTLSQFVKCLEKFGVIPYDSRGEAFDPERHEAMEVVESELFQPNMVIDEHRRGYLFNGRVIRPALVTVSKEPVRTDI